MFNKFSDFCGLRFFEIEQKLQYATDYSVDLLTALSETQSLTAVAEELSGLLMSVEQNFWIRNPFDLAFLKKFHPNFESVRLFTFTLNGTPTLSEQVQIELKMCKAQHTSIDLDLYDAIELGELWNIGNLWEAADSISLISLLALEKCNHTLSILGEMHWPAMNGNSDILPDRSRSSLYRYYSKLKLKGLPNIMALSHKLNSYLIRSDKYLNLLNLSKRGINVKPEIQTMTTLLSDLEIYFLSNEIGFVEFIENILKTKYHAIQDAWKIELIIPLDEKLRVKENPRLSQQGKNSTAIANKLEHLCKMVKEVDVPPTRPSCSIYNKETGRFDNQVISSVISPCELSSPRKVRHALFPVLMSQYFNRDHDTTEIVNKLQSLTWLNNQNNKISHKDLHLRLEYSNLIDFFKSSIADFLQDSGIGFETIEIPICWANKTSHAEMHQLHYHTNSMISGVYYVTSSKAKTRFVKTSYPTLLPSILYPNQYNAEVFEIEPSAGWLVLFPSQMHHSVAENKEQNIRYTISFNVFLRGEFGTLHNASYLKL